MPSSLTHPNKNDFKPIFYQQQKHKETMHFKKKISQTKYLFPLDSPDVSKVKPTKYTWKSLTLYQSLYVTQSNQNKATNFHFQINLRKMMIPLFKAQIGWYLTKIDCKDLLRYRIKGLIDEDVKSYRERERKYRIFRESLLSWCYAIDVVELC